jgi:hypothetical protein
VIVCDYFDVELDPAPFDVPVLSAGPPVIPEPLALPLEPVLVPGVLPAVLSVTLLPPGLVVISGLVVVALDELVELEGVAVDVGGKVVVVSSFLLHAAADSATATPIDTKSCLVMAVLAGERNYF